jgi:hypothetical protein
MYFRTKRISDCRTRLSDQAHPRGRLFPLQSRMRLSSFPHKFHLESLDFGFGHDFSPSPSLLLIWIVRRAYFGFLEMAGSVKSTHRQQRKVPLYTISDAATAWPCTVDAGYTCGGVGRVRHGLEPAWNSQKQNVTNSLESYYPSSVPQSVASIRSCGGTQSCLSRGHGYDASSFRIASDSLLGFFRETCQARYGGRV